MIINTRTFRERCIARRICIRNILLFNTIRQQSSCSHSTVIPIVCSLLQLEHLWTKREKFGIVESGSLRVETYPHFNCLCLLVTMTAALYSSHNGPGPSTPLMNELDFRDNRYPSIGAHSSKSTRDQPAPSSMLMASSGWEPEEKETSSSNPPLRNSSSRNGASDIQSSPEPSKSAVSYSLPQNNRRVVERYSLDNEAQQEPTVQQKQHSFQEVSVSLIPAAPRHPSLPAAGSRAGPSNTNSSVSPVIMPLSASPTYSPPISSRQRAYPQQPTYIQNVSHNPVNPVYLPNNPPAEEVCIECAMRDQDMADVDVTSPGIWDRESDIHYEELKRKELEEEASGIIDTEGPPRPKAIGGQLTESNLKLWLSVVRTNLFTSIRINSYYNTF